MKLTNSVVIDRPVADVFAAWSELERIPDWYRGSIDRTKTSDGPVGPGTTYRAVDRLPLGRRIEGTLTVTRYEPDRLISASLSSPYNAAWTATFEPEGESTRMTMLIEARPSGVSGLFAPLARPWARKVQQQGLERFKSDVESR